MHPYNAYHTPTTEFPEDMTRIRAFLYACSEIAQEEEIAKMQAGGGIL